MKTAMKWMTATGILLLLSACSKEQRIENRLNGIWNVDKLEEIERDGDARSTTNNGTIEFMEDGTGRYNVSYQFGGSIYTRSDAFQWMNSDETVTIIDNNSRAEIWTIEDNSRKTQVWFQLDDDGDKIVMTLTKR